MGFLRDCLFSCYEGDVCYCADLGGEDTDGHQRCFTRMSDDVQHGQLDACGCEIGCASCPDYPTDIIAHAAAGDRVADGQWRFLLPAAQDARGMMHELIAHHPHLVQQQMRWLRAANHNNYSSECVEEDDVPCNTWPWVEFGSGTPTLYCNGAIVGSPIDGYFGDGFFYHGTWPQEGEQLQCRRFPDEALRSTTVMSLVGNTIFLTSASSWHKGDGCGADWLIPGAGHITWGSTCLSAFQYVHAGSDPPQDDPTGPYAAHSGAPLPCQHLFDHIAVVSNDTTFVNRDGLDPHDIDLHNAILAKVREPGAFEGVEFDRLDHEARTEGNRGLGRFSRLWDGTGYPDGIMDPRLPVVRSYPASRTKWFNQPATAELVIVKVWFVLDLALPHTKTIYPETGTILFDRYDHIEPHCVVRIHVWLGLRVTIDGSCEAIYTDDLSEWPTITPDGNELLLAQEPGQWRWPPAFLEWHGVLNGFSQPSLQDQGYPNQVGEEDSVHGHYGQTLKNACTALETWIVPGAPVRLDYNPSDPNQHWTGEVRFNFTDSTDYASCYP